MKVFRCGVVVGKFSPLHRGHEFLIGQAEQACERVVILSYSKPEFPGCDAERRETWLAGLFPRATRLVLDDARLARLSETHSRWQTLPPNDAPAEEHRAFCAFLLYDVLGVQPDAVFSSESYGDGFAQALADYRRCRGPLGPDRDVTSVVVDAARESVPVSGSAIRADVHRMRGWLSPVVYASFVKRVAILGGESSGKTSLAHALAEHYTTCWAREYGRELWERKAGVLDSADYEEIASVQIAREEHLELAANRYVFCDTTPLTTEFYAAEALGTAPLAVRKAAERRYDLTLLCAPDFQFVQDGTRRDAAFRQRQHRWYEDEFARRGVKRVLVTGSLEHRVQQVEAILGSA